MGIFDDIVPFGNPDGAVPEDRVAIRLPEGPSWLGEWWDD